MAIWMRKCANFEDEKEADRESWARLSGDERVEALEDLRREAGKVTGESVWKDFEELFACLNAAGVRYLIIGGAFHAKPRFTKDIDVFIEPTAENARRVLEGLEAFGFGGVNLTADDLASPNRSFSWGTRPSASNS